MFPWEQVTPIRSRDVLRFQRCRHNEIIQMDVSKKFLVLRFGHTIWQQNNMFCCKKQMWLFSGHGSVSQTSQASQTSQPPQPVLLMAK